MGLEIRRGGTPPEGWEMSWGADEDSLSSPLPSGHSRLLCPHGSFIKTTMKRPPTTDNPSHKSFRIFTYLSVSL